MAWEDDQHTLDRVRDALDVCRVPTAFPETIALPYLVGELRSWLDDDRQWRHGRETGWRSLIQDTRASLEPYAPASLAPAVDHDALLDELSQCKRQLRDDDPHREELLRRRLATVCDQLEATLVTADARVAAWQDIVASASDPANAQAAARRLLDIAAWAGMDTEGLLRALQFCLGEGDQRPIMGPHHRLMRAADEVRREPRRTTITVWLRILFAQLSGGVIAVGPNVTLYAEAATFTERTGVSRHPTARLLRHHGDRLGRHLPTTTGRMADMAQLMCWLRDARSSPPAARLVLCDRAIETVSGWAGAATPRSFVERHLISSWSRRQMIGELQAIAIELYYNDQRHYLPDTHPDYQAWAAIC